MSYWLDLLWFSPMAYLTGGTTPPILSWENTYGSLQQTGGPVEPPIDQSGQGETKAVRPGFLTLCMALGVAATAAPVVYIAYKGRKRGKKGKANEATYLALEGASNRATSLLAGLAPAFAVPIAYIGVQELENKGIITKDLGNAVQGLMTAGVVAPAIGNIIGSVVGLATKGK